METSEVNETSRGYESRIYFDLPTLRSIRLLKIAPDQPTAEVKCSLTIFELDHAPPYEALSYVWGDPEPSVIVECDSLPKKVGPNLASALRQIRQQDEVRIVWIDALCINQSDLKERSCQVAFMRDIFARAERVLMWLGDDEGDVATALDLLDKAVNFSKMETTSSDALENSEEAPLERDFSRDFPPPKDPSWDAVVRLFERPYFKRAWIMQEVYHAKSPMILVGTHRRDWVDCGFGINWFLLNGYVDETPSLSMLIRAYFLWSLTIGKMNGTPPDFFADLLAAHIDLVEATDPRDKVYALYGLSRDITDPDRALALYPDYEKSVLDVYIDTIQYILEQPEAPQHGKLGFLKIGHSITEFDGISEGEYLLSKYLKGTEFELSRDTSVSSQRNGKPSWAPNWDSEEDLWDFSSIPEARKFCASKDLDVEFIFPERRHTKIAACKDNPLWENEAQNEQFGLSLRLKGIHVDIIRSSETLFKSFRLTDLSRQEARSKLWERVKDLWINTILPLENATRYTNREHLSNAFVQALTFNAEINRSKSRPPLNAYDFAAYCSWNIEAEAKDMDPEARLAHISAFPMPTPAASAQDYAHGDEELFARSIFKDKPLFVTDNGFIGIGHNHVKAGDVLCIFHGAITPHVIRPERTFHTLVGSCFVSEIMNGEAMDWNIEPIWFDLR